MLETDKVIFFLLPPQKTEACLPGFMLLINTVTGNHFEWSMPRLCFVDNPSALPDDVT